MSFCRYCGEAYPSVLLTAMLLLAATPQVAPPQHLQQALSYLRELQQQEKARSKKHH